MLTFETLSKLRREEEVSQTLSQLPDGFFKEVSSYISKKVQASKDKEDAWELENARMVLGDLLKSREKKILMAALGFLDSGVEPSNLTPEEKIFFEQISSIAGQFRERKKDALEAVQDRKSLMVLLEGIPQFVWTDMKTYGPFSENDIVNLPESLCMFLAERGVAKRIEPGKQGEEAI